MSKFSDLTRSLATLAKNRGWSPTPIQSAAMSDLLAGEHRLLVAPTGSGKTEAVALPLLSRAVDEKWDAMAILYITPLRALNRDIDRRLAELGEAAGLKIAVRHGDTPQNERNRQSRNPPHLLITTPETCQLLLIGSRLREGLRNLQAVVIDEVHDLAASERGAQLLVALERIDELCGRRVQRIGLSATVGNPKDVANWLSPTCQPLHAEAPRITDLEVVCEPVTAEDRALSVELHVSPRGLAALRRLATKVRETAPCLVFVNSRSSAETVAQRIQRIDGELRIGVHHGSLAAQTRKEMEEQLQAGELHGMICTSSLELGIDVGSIRQVHQLQSPRAVDRMLQRVGRADHVLGGISQGMLLCWEPDELGESAVIARRAMVGDLEGVEWRTNPRSVAANQLVLTALAEKVVPLGAATTLLQRTSLFEQIDGDEVLEILRILADRRLLKLVEEPKTSDPLRWPAALWRRFGEAGDELPEKRPTIEEMDSASDEVKRKWADTLRKSVPKSLADGWFSVGGKGIDYIQKHLSMIADEMKYSVRDAVSRKILGNLDETFVLTLDDGGAEEDGNQGRFVIAGMTWEVVSADPEAGELLVVPVAVQGSAPVWSGELPPVPADIAREVGQLRIALAEQHGWVETTPEIADTSGSHDPYVNAWIESLPQVRAVEEYPLSDHAYGALLESVQSHLDSAECLPHARLMTIENRRDAIVLNSCNGSKINTALAHFLQAMASTIDGKTGVVDIDPYRITMIIPSLTAGNITRWLSETSPEAIESIMRMTIPNGRQLRTRLVQVCKTFGVLQQGVDPRRVNISGIINRYRGTPLLDEALDKLFHERMDIEGMTDLLRAIQSGVVEIRPTASGALGRSPRSERDLLLPNWSQEEVRFRLKERLTNERVVLICLACKRRKRLRVARWSDDSGRCECGGTMLAAAREHMEQRLAEWVDSNDDAVKGRMLKNAQLVQQRGGDGVLCLMARGVGEETATRILAKTMKGDDEGLLHAIHLAELNYARTRRFWG